MTSVRTSMLSSSVLALVLLLVLRRFRLEAHREEDFTPLRVWPEPTTAIPMQPDDGPVMVTIEYLIDDADAVAFREVMRDSRRNRLQMGALSWGLFRDTGDPRRYIEYFVDESWVEHLRRFDRVTNTEVRLRERRAAFHRGDEPPKVRRYLAESFTR
jgi:hypothetical protein